MNQNILDKTQPQTSRAHKSPSARKSPSDFLLGLLMFVVFIIFMSVWLHFMLPEKNQTHRESDLSKHVSYTYFMPENPAYYRF